MILAPRVHPLRKYANVLPRGSMSAVVGSGLERGGKQVGIGREFAPIVLGMRANHARDADQMPRCPAPAPSCIRRWRAHRVPAGARDRVRARCDTWPGN